jgi:hypothetical protein
MRRIAIERLPLPVSVGISVSIRDHDLCARPPLRASIDVQPPDFPDCGGASVEISPEVIAP